MGAFHRELDCRRGRGCDSCATQGYTHAQAAGSSRCRGSDQHHSSRYLSSRSVLLRALVWHRGADRDRAWSHGGALQNSTQGWMQLHLTCMLFSFYILIGGGVKEVFL